MKTILLSTALSILYTPAWSCGNGECDPHPDEPGIETPEKPAEPQPEPEQPAPEKPQPEAPAPEPSQPESPAPEPEPETPAPQPSRPGPERDARADRCGGWIWGQRHRAECDQRRPMPRPYSLAAISDQTYVPSEKWQPMPQVCERTWFTLRFSIPAGMTKAAARQRCVEWLEGQ